jgi:hypothetical protein
MGKRSTLIMIGVKDGDHVTIEATPKVEAGWRTAHVSAHCGVWSGHFTAQFVRGELAKFGKEIDYLYEDPKRAAQLRGGEHYLELKLVDEGHGKVRVIGHAQERLGSKTALEFELELERGALPGIAKALIEADSAES